MTMSR